jgi:hypothetical protein
MPPPKTHVSDRSYEHESDFKPEDAQVLQRKTELQHPQLRGIPAANLRIVPLGAR